MNMVFTDQSTVKFILKIYLNLYLKNLNFILEYVQPNAGSPSATNG